MKTQIKYLLLLFLLFGTHYIFSQDENQFIKGIVLDAQTKDPVVFATIRIKNKTLGVVSNQDGGFRIPLEFRKLGDTLIFSSLGFQTKQLNLSSLKLGTINTIYLNEEKQQLQEVVVSGNKKVRQKLEVKEIVEKAIQNIPKNYPSSSFSLVGYYRDYQINRNGYLNLNEAVIEVFDKGFPFDDYNTTKVQLYDYRVNNIFKRDSIAAKPYDFDDNSKIIKNAYMTNQGGNEFTILRIHNAIRNYNKPTFSYIYTFQKDFIDGHNFGREPDTFLDDEPLYVLSFSKLESKSTVRGKIYISKNNFAIHKLDYGVYSRVKTVSKNESGKQKAISGVTNENLGSLIFHAIVEYQKREKAMYLNYISLSNGFQVKLPSEFQLVSQNINFEKSRVELRFNHTPKVSSASNKRKYEVLYKGKKMKLGNVQVKDKDVYVYVQGLNAIFDTEKGRYKKEIDISLEIKNVKDVYGNVFNRSRKYNLNQFREFFVQEVNTLKKAPNDSEFMIRTEPISKSALSSQLETSKKYWMNTPLKERF